MVPATAMSRMTTSTAASVGFFRPKKRMLQVRFSESWAPKIASGEPERSKLPVVRQTSQAEIAIRK